jgi:hypothetical protein
MSLYQFDGILNTKYQILNTLVTKIPLTDNHLVLSSLTQNLEMNILSFWQKIRKIEKQWQF